MYLLFLPSSRVYTWHSLFNNLTSLLQLQLQLQQLLILCFKITKRKKTKTEIITDKLKNNRLTKIVTETKNETETETENNLELKWHC